MSGPDREQTPSEEGSAPGGRGVLARVDAFQQRHRAVGLPLGVGYKYFDDGGNHLAALIAYFAFVSLFPLLLLASTVLGLVLVGHPDLQQRLLDSALAQLPVVGDSLDRPRQISGGALGVVVGALGALYGGMGVAQAMQNASNVAWTVPRNRRPNPFALRGRSLVLLGVIGADVVGTSVLAGLIGSAGFVGPVTGVAVLLGTLAVHAAAFATVFRFSTTRALSWGDVMPGAVTAAAAWLGLQYVGVAYVSRAVNSASATNGVFAVVLGLLAFLYLASTVVVLCIELNVVLAESLWPRTLLTPFTDNVVLTQADKKSYTDLATSQQLKGFERVDVEFDPSPAERRPRARSERDD
jgi:YihY family inner membrane protein